MFSCFSSLNVMQISILLFGNQTIPKSVRNFTFNPNNNVTLGGVLQRLVLSVKVITIEPVERNE